MSVRSLTSSQAHPAKVKIAAIAHSAQAALRAREHPAVASRLRAETMSVMRFLTPASAAGLMWCVAVSAAAQTAAEPTPSEFIAGVPAKTPEGYQWHAVFSPYALHFSG